MDGPLHRRLRMPALLIHLTRKDRYAHRLWLPRREGHRPLACIAKAGGGVGPPGVTNIRTFVDPTNRTRVGVLMDVPDMDAVMASLETQEGADAMAYDGVVRETW